jgi:regulator of ribonuclease activity A
LVHGRRSRRPDACPGRRKRGGRFLKGKIVKTADLMDAFQDELLSCEIQFKNYGGRTAFWGPCKTLRCRNDNVILRNTLEQRADGHVLVVDGGGSLHAALMGDIIAGLGHENNWSGIVIYGAVRDTLALGQIDFGVKALGSNPRKSEKKGAGSLDVEVSFGGLSVRPADWIYCDEDGIVVARRQLPI